MEYYVAGKKKELLPFATARIDLESVMVRELSQSETDKYYVISYVESNEQNKLTKWKQTHSSHREGSRQAG